ncbi:type II toxin-antitoxin system Phd/YefM family antitoxin [Candidatus Venteria ishoeyi]|uniref:Antitoxin n=1 Tax=Candidatus Venteria ishoeyi TaxID=1899563 RepID=A0A1H6FE37_9GAMM|nr:type II toxin-antitoxin system Phd/YefM family antitoxin [Candidatus Venteria ishoeyi]SEH07671.1 Antitoxin YefM [Candidatus Venteria ishoeyi]
MSQITLLTEASDNFTKLYHQAIDDREIIFIQEADTQEQVALIAADELSSLLETAYLLKSPNNAQRLLTALQRAKSQELPTQNIEKLKSTLMREQE